MTHMARVARSENLLVRAGSHIALCRPECWHLVLVLELGSAFEADITFHGGTAGLAIEEMRDELVFVPMVDLVADGQEFVRFRLAEQVVLVVVEF